MGKEEEEEACKSVVVMKGKGRAKCAKEVGDRSTEAEDAQLVWSRRVGLRART